MISTCQKRFCLKGVISQSGLEISKKVVKFWNAKNQCFVSYFIFSKRSTPRNVNFILFDVKISSSHNILCNICSISNPFLPLHYIAEEAVFGRQSFYKKKVFNAWTFQNVTAFVFNLEKKSEILYYWLLQQPKVELIFFFRIFECQWFAFNSWSSCQLWPDGSNGSSSMGPRK